MCDYWAGHYIVEHGNSTPLVQLCINHCWARPHQFPMWKILGALTTRTFRFLWRHDCPIELMDQSQL